jgi:small nuclear ribonucleoprotein (snRNP)-like protein
MTTDLIEKNKSLSEVKANLESSIAACPTDALCSKSKKSLDAVNSKMNENSNVIKSTMNKGNNEALTITGSASVSCTLGLCGGGASKQGTLYIFQRYLGDPSSQANETESVVQEGRETLALLNNYDPQSNPVLSEPEKESESSVAPKNPSVPNDATKVSKKVIRKCKKGKKFYKKNKSMCKQALQASR